MYAGMHVCMYAYIYIYLCIYIYMKLYVYMYVYVFVCVHTHRCIIYIYILIFRCTHSFKRHRSNIDIGQHPSRCKVNGGPPYLWKGVQDEYCFSSNETYPEWYALTVYIASLRLCIISFIHRLFLQILTKQGKTKTGCDWTSRWMGLKRVWLTFEYFWMPL